MSRLTPNDNPAIALDEQQGKLALSARVNDHWTMTKPGITFMVVITAYIGFAMAAQGEPWSPIALLAALLGTSLSCMGASVFNQIYERDTDALMKRTSTRPLPAGRMTVAEATAAASIYCLLGVAILWTGANWQAAALSAFTIFSYTLIYTPLKRMHSSSTVVGAFPGAMPPVIGYAAVDGEVGLPAILLFAVIFVWQLPHFYAIGYLYREEYAKAGMPILPVIDPSGARTFRHTLAYSVLLLIVGILPSLLKVSGIWALIVGLICGGGFLALAVQLYVDPSRTRARKLFLASLIYLPVVLAVILLDQA